jgi:hypothetical protein
MLKKITMSLKLSKLWVCIYGKLILFYLVLLLQDSSTIVTVKVNLHAYTCVDLVEWLAFLHPIWEVPDWNLGLETGYGDWGFSRFYSVPPGEFWDSAFKLGHDHFLPNPFQSIIHATPFRCYTVLVVEKASLNKLQINKQILVFNPCTTLPCTSSLMNFSIVWMR